MTQPENKLRHFASEDDLYDSCDNSLILQWVNELASLKDKQRSWGQRHRLKRKIFEQVAAKMLDQDELLRLSQQVEEELEARG